MTRRRAPPPRQVRRQRRRRLRAHRMHVAEVQCRGSAACVCMPRREGGGSDPFSPAPSRRTPSRRAVRPSSRSRPTSTSRSRRQIVSFSPPRPPRRTRQCQNINVWWWRRMLSARAPRPPSRVPDQTHCTRSDWRSWRAREGPETRNQCRLKRVACTR